MSGDAYYPNVSLLLHCDGPDGSTTFTDSSPAPKTVTAAGNAHIETDQAKYGTASAHFDGNGDYLQTPASTDFDFGTADFTIEAWVYLTSLTANARTIISRYATWATSVEFMVYIRNSDNVLIFQAGNSTPIVLVGNTTFTANNWVHVAVTRASGVTKMWVGGVAQTATHTGSVTLSSTAVLRIGANCDSTPIEFWPGYIDEVRITKGVARYTANFTPPAAAFINYAGQIAGVITDDASDPVARIVRAYRRDTGALVGNTTSSAGDGSYSMDIPTLEQCSVVVLDDASGDLFNDLIARVTPA